MGKEQIIKALEICTSPDQGASCPIKCLYGDINNCEQSLLAHSLALIREQEKQISELEANNKDLADERDRYFDMVCRAVDNAANYEEHTDVTIKGYFDFTDEEYDAVTKYIQNEFYKDPDVTDDPCAPDAEVLGEGGDK